MKLFQLVSGSHRLEARQGCGCLPGSCQQLAFRKEKAKPDNASNGEDPRREHQKTIQVGKKNKHTVLKGNTGK